MLLLVLHVIITVVVVKQQLKAQINRKKHHNVPE